MNLLTLIDNKDIPALIIIIIISVILVVCGAVFFVIFARHSHVKKLVNDLIKKYHSLHNMLTVQLESDLKRVYNIAQINIEYEPVYNLNQNVFNDVIEQEDAIALEAVNSLDRLLAEKKYRIIKEEMFDVKCKVNDLEAKCDALSKSLNDIIMEDDENRQEILRYRREFREVKDGYENRKSELKYLENSFTAVFEKLESYFLESENYLAGAHYAEAKENFPEIEKVIKALKTSLSSLPKLVTLSFVVMPNNIEELVSRYNSLSESGFPLHHLMFQSTIEQFKLKLEGIQHKLSLFQTKNVEYELNQIRDAIILIDQDFDAEQSARKYFTEEFEEVYNSSYKMENKFIKLRRSIPSYKETYLLKDSCVDILEKIQNEIDDLGTIKRTLDTYVHSASKQPYSILAGKLKVLSNAMKQIETDIDSVYQYLKSLKDDSNNGYEFITTVFIELKKCESIIRKIDVNSITNIFIPDFKECYGLLHECGDIINNMPINVALLNEYIARLSDCFNSLENKIAALPEAVRKAEEAVVYANQYRQAFDDVKSTLLRAEKSFFEGDFQRTNDETVAMLKKIRPEAGK